MAEGRRIALVTAGTALLLSALSLLLHNGQQNAQAGQDARRLLGQVEAVIQEQPAPDAPEGMPAMEIEGGPYAGVLSIPKLELELPVMAQWDYEKLKLAPCRQFGSVQTGDLVIAAHNYQNHFGRLPELEAGDGVTFTDMEGTQSHYTLAKTQTLAPAEAAAVQNSGYPLVLYTCTYSGKSRVVLFFDPGEAPLASPS